MLEVSSLSNMEGDFSMRSSEEFLDCSEANLLDNIDFDDLFGVEFLHEVPDLEMDPDLLPDLFNGYDEVNNDVVFEKQKKDDHRKKEIKINKKLESNSSSSSCLTNNNRKNNDNNNDNNNNNDDNSNNSNNNNNQTKRKTKVEWTPELHRRFVQVVEQLGVDKAVPSRILELMGNHCLTRHNIASHLQKYRSHRKHLLARETEAMNRTSSMGGGKGGGGGNMSPWYPPTMGYPPMTNMHHPSFRPLHVWGHPQARVPMPMWPKQLNVVPSTCPLTPTWAPNPSFWHLTQQRRVGVAQVPVQGIPPHTMFKPDQSLLPQPPPQSGSHSSIDPHPSKESIDAAIGDVLAKPWQPLPIGLKPPSTDTVLVELKRQGIFKIPPYA